jgi:hypothetical protein
VLIGTGWSYMKPFIDDRTRQVLMIVIPLQVGSMCQQRAVDSSYLLNAQQGRPATTKLLMTGRRGLVVSALS